MCEFRQNATRVPVMDAGGYIPRSAGIAVELSGLQPFGWSPVSVGDLVEIEGVLMSDGAELYIADTELNVIGESRNPAKPELSSPPKPIFMTGIASGGGAFGNQPGVFDDFWAGKESSGLNSIGLLVTMTGVARECNPLYFYLDDGSGLVDGSFKQGGGTNTGIKVDLTNAGTQIPSEGSYVRVTGIFRAEEYFGRAVRALWPRGEDDIIPIRGMRN